MILTHYIFKLLAAAIILALAMANEGGTVKLAHRIASIKV